MVDAIEQSNGDVKIIAEALANGAYVGPDCWRGVIGSQKISERGKISILQLFVPYKNMGPEDHRDLIAFSESKMLNTITLFLKKEFEV